MSQEQKRQILDAEKLLNLERLGKTGVIELFKEIKKEEFDGKYFKIVFDEDNTGIELHWDIYNTEYNIYGCKILRATIKESGDLSLQKITTGTYSDKEIYTGTESIVDNNLNELVFKKYFENTLDSSTTKPFQAKDFVF